MGKPQFFVDRRQGQRPLAPGSDGSPQGQDKYSPGLVYDSALRSSLQNSTLAPDNKQL